MTETDPTTDPDHTPVAQILNDFADDGPTIAGRWETSEFVVAIMPAFVVFLATALLPSKPLTIIGIALTVVLLMVGVAALAVKPDHHTLTEFAALRGRWLTRQAIMTHARSDDGTSQHANHHSVARRFHQRIPRLGRLVADTSGQSTQDWLGVDRLHRGHNAVELADGTVTAAIKISPANLSTKTPDDWQRIVGQLSDALSTAIDFEIAQVATLRPLDQKSYREGYERRRQEHPTPYQVSGMANLRARLLEERCRIIQDDQAFVRTREHYLIVKVQPWEMVEELEASEGFFGSLANAPFFGDRVRQRRLRKQLNDREAFRDQMLARLDRRVDRVSDAIARVEGVSTTPISATQYTQALMDYYGAEDAFALDESTVRDLLAVGPVVDADACDATTGYEVDTRLGEGERYRSLLAPASVARKNPAYLTLDNEEYVTTFWIEAWPDTPKAGMFEELLATCGLDVTLTTHAVGMEKHEADDEARRQKIEAKTEYEKKQEQGHWGADAAYRRWQSAADVEAALEESSAGLFVASTYITVRANDPETLEEDATRVMHLLRERPARTQPIRAHFQQDDAFKSASPAGLDLLSKATPMLGTGLAKQLPYAAATMHEPSGVEFGIHADRNEPVVIDPFQRKMGYNMGVIGNIGSGKSTSSKKVVTELKQRYPEMNVVLIDPLEGLVGVNNVFEGERIVIGGDVGLNPFAIEPIPPEKRTVVGKGTAYKQAVDRGISFLETYYDLEGLAFADKRGLWEYVIKTCYEEHGITRDPSTHDRPSPTMHAMIATLEDIVQTPYEHVSIDDDGLAQERKQTAIRILNEDIEPFLGGKYSHLAKQTGFDLDADDTFYLDLQMKEGKGETGLMLGLLLTAAYEMAKTADKRTLIVIDEAHYLTKHADNLAFLEQAVRHSRHYDLSILFSTQSVSEFFTPSDDGIELRDSAKVILDNMSILMFYHLNEMGPEIADELGLNSEEMQFVQEARPGDPERGFADMLLAVDREGQRECFPLRVEMDWEYNPVEFAVVDYEPSDHGDWHDYLHRKLGVRFDDDGEKTASTTNVETLPTNAVESP